MPAGGSEVGIAYVTLATSGKGLVGSIQREMNGAGGTLTGEGKKAGGLFGGAMGSALGSAMKVAGIAGVGAALLGAASSGIKFDSAIEQTTISMSTMLGSMDAAKSLIGDVTKMAAATPFEFPELAEATKKLIAYGVPANTVVDTMRRLGDVSAGLSIPIGELSDVYGKIRVQGRVFMEDINQLSGRGIPIYKALAETMGVNESKIRDMVSAGEIGFPQIEAAFKSMTDEGGQFAGLMDAQSRSLSGLWSTIKDNVKQVFGKVMKPIFDWLVTSIFPKLVKLTDAFNTALSGGGEGLGGFFKKIGSTIVGAVPGIVAGLAGLVVSMGTWLVQVGIPMLASYVARLAGDFIGWIVPKLPDVLLKLWSMVQGLASWVVGTALPWLAGNLGRIAGDFIEWLIPKVPLIIGALVVVLVQIVAWIFTDLIPGIVKTLAILGYEIIKGIAMGFAALFVWLYEKGAAVMHGLWNGIKEVFWSVIGWFGELPGKVKGAIGDLGNLLYDSGKAIIDGLWRGMKWVWDKVVGWYNSSVGWLVDKIGKFFGIGSPSKLMFQYGKWIMEGLDLGMKAAFPNVVNSAASAADSILGGFGVSPSGSAMQPALAGAGGNVSSTTAHNTYYVTLDASKMPSPDFRGFIASLEMATNMNGGQS
jgi:tape measure domain-containing protein